jgi:hypothetical protein
MEPSHNQEDSKNPEGMEIDENQGAEDMKRYQQIIAENEKNKGNVTKDDFETYSLLGEGSYGRVILVKKKDTGI